MPKINKEGAALLAYVRVCAKDYPGMTVARVVELAEELAKNIDDKGNLLPKVASATISKPTNVLKKLTEKQSSLLDLIIQLHRQQLPTTRKELGERRNADPTAIKFLAEALVEKGYVSQTKKPGGRGRRSSFFYTPIKNAQGQLIGEIGTTKENGVTKCPPRYATGYGIDNSDIAGGRI